MVRNFVLDRGSDGRDRWTEGTQKEKTAMTPDEINALPDRVRQYIHDLETNADPAGTIQENALLKDQTRELDAMIAKLKKENEHLDGLLDRVWDLCRDRKSLFVHIISDIRTTIREKPDKKKKQHPMNAGVEANMHRKEDWDCGCSDAATDVCVSVTCPRR